MRNSYIPSNLVFVLFPNSGLNAEFAMVPLKPRHTELEKSWVLKERKSPNKILPINQD